MRGVICVASTAQYFYWESVVNGQKIGTVVIAQFLYESAEAQVWLALGLVVDVAPAPGCARAAAA